VNILPKIYPWTTKNWRNSGSHRRVDRCCYLQNFMCKLRAYELYVARGPQPLSRCLCHYITVVSPITTWSGSCVIHVITKIPQNNIPKALLTLTPRYGLGDNFWSARTQFRRVPATLVINIIIITE